MTKSAGIGLQDARPARLSEPVQASHEPVSRTRREQPFDLDDEPDFDASGGHAIDWPAKHRYRPPSHGIAPAEQKE